MKRRGVLRQSGTGGGTTERHLGRPPLPLADQIELDPLLVRNLQSPAVAAPNASITLSFEARNIALYISNDDPNFCDPGLPGVVGGLELLARVRAGGQQVGRGSVCVPQNSLWTGFSVSATVPDTTGETTFAVDFYYATTLEKIGTLTATTEVTKGAPKQGECTTTKDCDIFEICDNGECKFNPIAWGQQQLKLSQFELMAGALFAVLLLVLLLQS